MIRLNNIHPIHKGRPSKKEISPQPGLWQNPLPTLCSLLLNSLIKLDPIQDFLAIVILITTLFVTSKILVIFWILVVVLDFWKGGLDSSAVSVFVNIGWVGQIPKTIIRTKDPNNHSDRTYLPLLLRANYLGNLKTKQKQCSIEYYFQEKFFLLLSMTMLKKVTFFQFKLIFFDIRHQCFAWNKTKKSLDVFPKKKLWWSLGNITFRFVDNHIYRKHFIGSFWLKLSQLLSIL